MALAACWFCGSRTCFGDFRSRRSGSRCYGCLRVGGLRDRLLHRWNLRQGHLRCVALRQLRLLCFRRSDGPRCLGLDPLADAFARPFGKIHELNTCLFSGPELPDKSSRCFDRDARFRQAKTHFRKMLGRNHLDRLHGKPIFADVENQAAILVG